MKLGAESIIQINVCGWLTQCTDLPFYHIPMEGKRSWANAAILHKMGMKAGMSDLFLPRGNKDFKGVFLELKAGKNKPTATQVKFMLDMEIEGYYCTWTNDADKAIDILKAFYSL